MTRVKLTFGPPDVTVERRPDGALLVRSPHPLGPYPAAMTDWLDHWAKVAPDRVFLAEREGAAWRKVTYAAGAQRRAQHRSRVDRPGPRRRAAGRDPVGQQRRPCVGRAWRDDRGRALCAGLAALFAGREGFRQAENDHRHSDAGPHLRRRRRSLHGGDRSGRPKGRRGRRTRQSADDPPVRHARIRPRKAGRAGSRRRPGEGRTGHDRQAPVHLWLDRGAQGRHQHAAHDDLEPGHAEGRYSEPQRRAAGSDRLAAVEPHIRRQQQFQSRSRERGLVLH